MLKKDVPMKTDKLARFAELTLDRPLYERIPGKISNASHVISRSDY
jgi:hypothetical protein